MSTQTDRGTASSRPVWLFMAATAMATTVSTLAATAMARSDAPEPTSVTCACDFPTAMATPVPTAPAVQATPAVTPDTPAVTPDTPVAKIPRADVSSSMDVDGKLDKGILRRIVRAHINEVRHCYNQGLSSDPELAGKVVVGFLIGPQGTVLESTVNSTTLDDTEVGECIATAVSRWRFPKPSDGRKVHVAYPFVLTPG